MPENKESSPVEHTSPTFSRREFMKRLGIGAAGAALAMSGIDRRPVLAKNALITKENVGNFSLEEIAEQKGKIMTFQVNGFDLASSIQFQSRLVSDAGRLENADDFIWIHDYSGDPNPDNISWSWVDRTIDFAQKNDLSYAAQNLIFGDMGEGQSTNGLGIRLVPDWLIEGNYDYDQSIQLGNDYIKAAITHLQEKEVFDPKDKNANKKLRIGVLNELLNNSLELYNQSQAKGTGLDDPSIWFKGANYWQDQANKAGDTQPIPRYIKEFLLTAKKYAGNAKIGISDYGIETWNDYNGDPSGSTPNQKTQVMYNFIKAMKEDPDLKDIIDENFYVGMQGHWDAKQIQAAGVDKYAQDVEDTVKRFKELGVDVVVTEASIRENDLPGSPEEQANQAGDMWGKVPVAALRGGASELAVFWPLDGISSSPPAGIFYHNSAPKPGYAALAEGLVSLPDAKAA